MSQEADRIKNEELECLKNKRARLYRRKKELEAHDPVKDFFGPNRSETKGDV